MNGLGSLAGRHHILKGARELRRQDIPQAIAERFLTGLREQKGPLETSCLEWRGAVNGDGYGVVVIAPRPRRRFALAHRVAYAIETGICPTGLVIDHQCHNRRCCRVSHHRLTTGEVNTPGTFGLEDRTPARGEGSVRAPRPIIDTEGRTYASVDEWMDEVRRRAIARVGHGPCTHGYLYHAGCEFAAIGEGVVPNFRRAPREMAS